MPGAASAPSPNDSSRIALEAGEQLVISPSAAPKVTHVNTDRATAWESGKLVFDDEPLSTIVVRVSRYGAHPIIIGDEPTSKLRISGVFHEGDVAGFVSTIVSYLPVRAQQDRDGSIHLTARPPETHWKPNTSVGYAIGPVSAALHWRYIASMRHQDQIVDPTATTPGVPAYSYFDFEAHWSVLQHLEITAGLTNLFDKGPPFVSGQPLTTDTATYDIIGLTYYAGIKAKF